MDKENTKKLLKDENCDTCANSCKDSKNNTCSNYIGFFNPSKNGPYSITFLPTIDHIEHGKVK